MLVVPQEGSLILVELLRSALPSPLRVHLFVNDFIPDWTSTLTDFNEATFPGYTPGTASFPNPPSLNFDNAAEIDAGSPAVFNSTGPSGQTAYGYWVDNGTYDKIWWCERFASPVTFFITGSFVQIALGFTGITEFTG